MTNNDYPKKMYLFAQCANNLKPSTKRASNTTMPCHRTMFPFLYAVLWCHRQKKKILNVTHTHVYENILVNTAFLT